MASDSSQISEREREILRLVAQGATNPQIAQQLHISVNTVKVHVRNIFSKIGVTSRAEAALYAARIGLVQVGGVPVVALPQVPVAEVGDDAGEESLVVTAGGGEVEVPPCVDALMEPVGHVAVEQAVTLVVSPEVGEVSPRVSNRQRQVWLFVVGGGMVVLLVVLVSVMVSRALVGGQPAATLVAGGGLTLPQPDERWHELAQMPSGRSGFALAYSDRRLYVVGGMVGEGVSDQVLRFDLVTNTWVGLSPKPTAVTDVQAAVIGNKIYVPGGRLQSGGVSDRLEVYDPQRELWAALSPLPQARSGYALVAVEGKLYLFGGWDGSTYRAEVWQYSPDEDRWAVRSPMPTARAFAGAATIEGRVYVMGGVGTAGLLTVTERYAPASDGGEEGAWVVLAPLPAPRSHMAVAAIGGSGLIFVLNGSAASDGSLLYRYASDSWQPLETPLNAGLSDLRAEAIANKLYIVGGQEGGARSDRVYEYLAIYTVLMPLDQGH